MQRLLSRAASRCASSSAAFKTTHIAQANAISGVRSREASTCSNVYGDFTWSSSLDRRIMQADIVNALRRGDRHQASIMLSNFKDSNEVLTSEDFSYMLEYCAETPDPLFAMETLEMMEEKGVDMSKNIYESVTRALCKGGYLKEVLHWLTLLVEKESSHSILSIFNIFLSYCGSTRNLNDVESCLEKMETHLLGKSEITYCEILKVAFQQRNLSAVHDIWKECTRYYSPSMITQKKFLEAFARLGDLQSACCILQHMVVLAGQSNKNTDYLRVSSKRRHQSPRLDIPVPALNEIEDLNVLLDSDLPQSFQRKVLTEEYLSDTQPELFQEVNLPPKHKQLMNDGELISADNNLADKFERDSGKMQNILRFAPVALRTLLLSSFNVIIHACVEPKNIQLAEQLFQKMHKIGLWPSRYTYDGFIKTVIGSKGPVHASKVIEALERRGFKPHNDTLAALSVGYSRNLQLDLAEDFLERISEIKQKHIHAFNVLLSRCETMDEPERAISILRKIKHLKLKPDIKTYEILFSLFGYVNVPYEFGNTLSRAHVWKRITTIQTDMLNNGIQYSVASMKNMIRAFGAETMIEEMLRYLNAAENYLWMLNPYQKSHIYSIVLHSLVLAKEAPKAMKIFKIMKLYCLPINSDTYNIMIECCRLLHCSNSSNALLSLMLRDGIYPDIRTFTSLIKVVLTNKGFESALDLLDRCIIQGIQPDVQIFNAILREASYKGQIHVVEYILERMHRAKIQPDQTTLWYTFCAYVHRDLDNTGIEALQVLSMRMISKDSGIPEERRVALEGLILSEEPEAELRIMEMLKAAGGERLATALLNLRLCAIMGATIRWSPEESLWARRLASSYDADKRPQLLEPIRLRPCPDSALLADGWQIRTYRGYY